MWQPIETAPKDGTHILVFVHVWDDMVMNDYHVAFFDKLWRGSTGEGSESWIYGEPTHWMPLPEPPKDV